MELDGTNGLDAKKNSWEPALEGGGAGYAV